MKGGLTGFIEAIICYPTEFVKTQLQLQSKAHPATCMTWMGGMVEALQDIKIYQVPLNIHKIHTYLVEHWSEFLEGD